MKQATTHGIVLSRTDYGEADRIITLLTPDRGKLRIMARGVRKAKSKLAGSIELFSTADITFIAGRGEIGTLISARLIKHYGRIIQNIDRVQLGYELIKMLNKNTEDEPEAEYFELLERTLAALDNPSVPPALTRVWFEAQLLRLAGHSPNLQTTVQGDKLAAGQTYDFDFDSMSLFAKPEGLFGTDQIKFMRLLFSGSPPEALAKVQGSDKLVEAAAPNIQMMLHSLA